MGCQPQLNFLQVKPPRIYNLIIIFSYFPNHNNINLVK